MSWFMLKSKWSAFLYLLLVFLSGALVGSFAHRFYMVNTVTAVQPRRPDPEAVRRKIVADMRQQIKLDDQQVSQVEQILDQTRAEFHQMRDRQNAEGQAIHDKQIAAINGILREDQRPLYAQYRAQRDAERKRHEPKEKK